MIRSITNVLVRGAIRSYYHRVDIAGEENLPAEGPLMLVANHYNSLVDPLVIQAVTPRWTTFAAAEFLFRGPIGPAMKALGMIPIYRASDSPDPKANLNSFRRCFEVLEAGGAFAIFPEGVSHDESHVLRVKSGAGRILFGVEEKNNFTLGVTVVPMGLVYEGPSRFGGSVTAVIGEPIDTAPLIEIAREKPQRALRQFTNQIQEALERVTFSQDTWDDYRLVNQAARFYMGAREDFFEGTPPTLNAEERVDVRSKFRQGFFKLLETEPETLKQLREELLGYNHLLWRLGITDRHVRSDYPPKRVLHFIVRNLEMVLFGWPVATWGIANNSPGLVIVREVVKRLLKPKKREISANRIFVGIGVFTATSAIQTALVTWGCVTLGWPWWLGLIYLASLPLSGWYAASFIRRRREAYQSLHAWLLLAGPRQLKQTLRRRRERIVSLMKSLLERRSEILG